MPGAARSMAARKEFDCAMRQQKRQQGEQNAAGMESPGEKKSSCENGDVVKTERWSDLNKNRTIDERCHQRQQKPPRNQPRFPGFPVHAPLADSRSLSKAYGS